MNRTSLVQTIIVIFTAAIFFIVMFLGYSTGKNVSISNIVIQNTKQLAVGFKYFKADQDRYPSEFEYSNQDLMSNYFNVFPPADIITKTCPQNFVYKSPDSKGYALDFCIPRASGGYGQGWNVLPSPNSLE